MMDVTHNKFSAYLVVAVSNKRMQYMKKKKKLMNVELNQIDVQEKNYEDFEKQYTGYVAEKTAFILSEWERYPEWMIMIESRSLFRCIRNLKERERKLLFARVFGELSFKEIGEKYNMTSKQAEMAFYYILRKIRKELEVRKNDKI